MDGWSGHCGRSSSAVEKACRIGGGLASKTTRLRVFVRKTVYLDTTIPSYLFDERESIRIYVDITKKWWDEERQRFDLWMSGETAAELRNEGVKRFV